MAKLQSVNAIAGKETIYVDVDDEITAIIDKVGAAKGKIIALVLPKRATVLQSIVNMKLLKRTAENAGKNLVLVTSEAGLMPLAGSVGLHVASTPSSKPAIPLSPVTPDDATEDIDEPLDISDGTADEAADFDEAAASGKTVGELAATGAASKLAASDVDESIDMGEDPADAPEAVPLTAAAVKKNKKLKVPNFDSFRKKIALAVVVLIVLIGAWIVAFTVLPKATITVHTDSSTITTNLNLTLDAAAHTLDTTNDIVPATSQSQQKTSTTSVPATGQQNNGQKATGTVTFTATACAPNINTPASIPVGSSVKSGGNVYITQETANYQLSGSPHGSCANYSTNATDITALKGGASYNTASGSSFTGAGTGTGSASGGTDNITKIVTATDIDTATSKIKSDDTSSVKTDLTSGLQSKGLQPVASTFLAGTPQVTTSAQAGDPADNVTVTAVTTYTMLGVQKSDLQKLVTGNVESQLDKGKQVILDDGVANAEFTQATPGTATTAAVAMQTKSQAGPQLNVAQLKTQLAGKKSGDVKSYLKQTPGVNDVDVSYSPFWVSSVPKKAGKVTIQIVKAGN